MSTKTFANIEPVKPGYPWETRIVFPEAFWTAEQMQTGEIEADIRSSMRGELITQLRTDTGGIKREDRTLVLSMTDEQTAKIGSAIIVFDFAREAANGTRRAIAGRWTWPVIQTVTRADG